MAEPVRSSIVIDAPPERVFAVVADLDAYPAWNPFTPRITLASADLAVGAELDLDCQMTPTQLLRDEREVVLELDRTRFLFCMGTSRKRGRPGIRSCRRQQCEPLPDGRTAFSNSEEFEGPLAPIVYWLYRAKLERAFVRYCQALKARVESMPA